MRQIVFIAILFIIPCVTTAQLDDFGANTDISIEAQPAFPAPFESVDLSLNAFSIDTTGASITWFINNQEVRAGQNIRSITETTGELGEQMTVQAVLRWDSGRSLSVSHTIIPVRLDLIIEADTTVPSFYEGRPLPSVDSPVRLIAEVNTGNTSNPSNYTYLWQQNNTVLYSGPVKGKFVADTTLTSTRDQIISVTVFDQNNTRIAERTVEIPVAEPEVHFYEDNPLRGTSYRALTNSYQLIGEETTIFAEPYYLDTGIYNKEHLIEWEIDGQTVDNPNINQKTITLRQTGDIGLFQIGFHIRNLEQLLQGAEQEFVLRF